MRSGSLLLFTLIPSSILAASPIPVKSPEFTPAIASGLSSAVPPKNPTVTLLDGETGEISNTGTFPSPQLQYSLTQTIFVDVFRMPQKSMEKSMKPIYKGLYNPLPPKRRKWIYFKITGFPGCPTEEHPCFGWMAMGLSKWRNKSRIYGQKYIGISSGKPARGYFLGEGGKPINRGTPAITALYQKEWYKLLEGHKLNFMIHAPPSVTFIGIDGKPLTGVGQKVPEADLTKVINGALRRDSEHRVAFHGRYDPVGGSQQWVYFKLIAPDWECTEESPCFGWIAQGHSEDGQSFHGCHFNNHAQTYVGIVKPHAGIPSFTHIGSYPGTPILDDQYAVADVAADMLGGLSHTLPAQEMTWVCMMDKFQMDWSEYH